MRKVIAITGIAGSGKSTIAKELVGAYDALAISTGDIARGLSDTTWEDAGDLSPEDAFKNAFYDTINDSVPDDSIVIVDGMPRRIEQIEYLKELFDRVVIVRMQVSSAEAKKRLLKRGRKDDREDIIKNRLKLKNVLMDIENYIMTSEYDEDKLFFMTIATQGIDSDINFIKMMIEMSGIFAE